MKTKKVYLSFVFIILALHNILAQDEYFNRVFYYYVSNALFGVVVKDTFYYSAGTIRDSINAGKCRVFINKVSQNGDIIWSKSWGEANKDYVAAWKSPLIHTHDNGFAIIGGILDSTSFWHSYLMKFNSNFDTLWKKEFYDTISTYPVKFLGFNNIKETLDKGFIIVGEVQANHQSDSEIYLIKTDSLGETEWFKTLGQLFKRRQRYFSNSNS